MSACRRVYDSRHLTEGWLPRTGISSGTLRSVIEYGLPLPFYMRRSKYWRWEGCESERPATDSRSADRQCLDRRRTLFASTRLPTEAGCCNSATSYLAHTARVRNIGKATVLMTLYSSLWLTRFCRLGISEFALPKWVTLLISPFITEPWFTFVQFFNRSEKKTSKIICVCYYKYRKKDSNAFFCLKS